MFEYKMPQEIKTKFTKDFMADFLTEVVQVFNLNESAIYYSILAHLTGTYGWVNAFRNTCLKHQIKDVYKYYDDLEWYNSDLFDGEFGRLLVDYELIKE